MEESLNEAAFHRERPWPELKKTTKYRGTCSMFIHSNNAILSSAAIERLFSVGKDVLKPKRSGLTDQHFEMLVFLKGACNQSMKF